MLDNFSQKRKKLEKKDAAATIMILSVAAAAASHPLSLIKTKSVRNGWHIGYTAIQARVVSLPWLLTIVAIIVHMEV